MNKKILTMLMALAMLVSIVPMAAMAAEDECEHDNCVYVSTDPGYHDMKCMDCGYMYGFTFFKCENADDAYDGICDKCGYQYKAPAHTCTQDKLVSISDTQHQYQCICGKMVGVAVNHADSNADGSCDSCSYVMYTKPEGDHEHNYIAHANGNGTHYLTCNCGLDVKAVTCLDNDGDNYCDSCGYVKYTGGGEHEHNYIAHSNSDGTHYLTCNCGLDVKDVTCLDNDGDGKCDSCGYVKYTGGGEHEHNYIAHSNSDGTHYLTCNCGLDVKDVTCLDNNGDGKCDSCGYQKYAPVCDHGFQYVVDNGDGKTHKATCGDCGVVIAEKMEHVFDQYGVCACGAIQSTGCDHDGEQKVTDNKDGRTHKVTCGECGEMIAEKAEHDYSATTGKCACGAKKPVNKPTADPNLDDVPKTGNNAAVITLISMILIGSVGSVMYFWTDKKYF